MNLAPEEPLGGNSDAIANLCHLSDFSSKRSPVATRACLVIILIFILIKHINFGHTSSERHIDTDK